MLEANDFDTALYLNDDLQPARLKFRQVNDQLSILQNTIENVISGLLILALIMGGLGLWQKYGSALLDRIRQAGKVNFLILGVYLALASFAYRLIFSPSFFFLFDDFYLIHVGRMASLLSIFREGFIGFYRPLAFVTLAMDYKLWGWDYPLGYGLSNLLFHVFSSFLAFLIIKRLSVNQVFAFFTGLLFVLHFRHTESVTWISGRFDVLSTFFYLFAFYVYLISLETSKGRFYALSVTFFALSLLTKEMAASFPIVILLVEIFTHRKNIFNRHTIRQILLKLFPLLLVLVMYVFARQTVLKGMISAYGNVLADLTPQSILETYYECFLSLLLPYFSPGLAPAVGLMLVVVISLQLGLKRSPQLLLLLGAFIVSLIPVISFDVCLICTRGERFLYLPSFFFAGVVVLSLLELPKLWPGSILNSSFKERLSLVLLSCYVLLSATGLVEVNKRWQYSHRIGKQVMQDLQKYAQEDDHDTILIFNIPQGLRSGPYALRDYDFEFYFYDQKMPTLKSASWAIIDEIYSISWVVDKAEVNAGEDALVLGFDPKVGGLKKINRETPAP